MRLLASLLAAGALLLGSPAAATTRYVATSGSDSNPGTLTAPLATLNRACALSTAGDEVLVRGGVYLQRASLSCNGTANARLRFAPYPGEAVVLDGSLTAPDTNVVGIFGDHIDFEGFEVRNSKRTGISVWGVSGVRISNNLVHDCELGGIWVGFNAANGNLDVTIQGNTVHTTATRFYPHTTTSGWPVALSVGNTYGGLVTGNIVYRNHGEGIGIGHSRYVDVLANVVHDNYSTNIYLDNTQDSVVSGNFVYSEREPMFFRYDGPANGISIANEFSTHVFQDSARIIVSNNVINAARYGIYYGNFQFGTGLHDSLIAHNTVYRTDLAALRIDDAAHTNTRVEQNLVVQEPGRVLASVAGSGLTFARNGWWGGTPPVATNGVGDINAAPGFVNPGTIDARGYRISTNSPMASAGLKLALVGADFDTQPRTAPTSLGAFEVTAASPRMGIAAVAIGHGYRSRRHHYAASVAIADAAGLPVAGVNVSGRWSGALSGSFDVVTDSTGLATMPALFTRSNKSVTFMVTSVSRAGYIHDAALDQQTSATFTP